MENDVRTIPVTKENIWFLQKQFNVFNFLDFFPEDSIGAASENENKNLPYQVHYLIIKTDAGFSFETDIPKGKFIIRQSAKSRNGTGKWMIDREIKPGDTICLKRTGEYEYYLYKQ